MSMFPGSERANEVSPNDKEKIDASVASKESKLYASKKLARFFELEISLKIFGEVIFHWVFPPSK